MPRLLILYQLIFQLFAVNYLVDAQDEARAFLIKQYMDAITAYGPGLGVYTPYSYVDISYDNLPLIGKIPLPGKEGTASRLGISPFYPPNGNPGNPLPPLYKARPLPPNIPEPVDVVAVPLDEEALHGEPLFPPELSLPGEALENVGKFQNLATEEDKEEAPPPVNPFGDLVLPQKPFKNVDNRLIDDDVILKIKNKTKKDISSDTIFFEDSAVEKNDNTENVENLLKTDKSPLATVIRRKRIRRFVRSNNNCIFHCI